jgi:hypothetical protein
MKTISKLLAATLCGLLLPAHLVFSQPNVEWQKSYWGYTYPTSPHQPTTPIGPDGVTHIPISHTVPDLTSEDWFYFHGISKGTDNKPNGYICAGYSKFLNYIEYDKTGCYQYAALDRYYCEDLETFYYRKGNDKQVLSLIDLNGNVQWYKTFSNGDMSNVIQTADGGYVAIGAGKSTEDGQGNLIGYNGVASNTFVHGQADVGVTGAPHKIRIVKVDRNGNKLWEYMYGMEPYVGNGSAAFAKESRTVGSSAGGGIIETSEGDILFTASAVGTNGFKRACVFRITSTGSVIWSKYVGATTIDSYGCAIAKTGTGSNQKFYISYFQGGWGQEKTAVLFQLDNGNPATVAWEKSFPKTSPSSNEGTRPGTTIAFDAAGHLLFPMIFNIVSPSYIGYKAEGRVYRLNPANGNYLDPAQPTTPTYTSLGAVSAYDLTVGVTATADGGFAAVSSTNRLFDPANLNKYYFPAVTNNGESCSVNRAADANGVEYGFNDGIVTKCDASGGIIWSKIFDNNNTYRQPGLPSTWQYPDHPQNRDLRRTECLYTIVQAPDGGYVVAGNNSQNMDDSYVVKLGSECYDVTVPSGTINTSLQYNVYASTNYIYASNVTIPAGPFAVDFRAGNAIVLSPDFLADNGSVFTAYIDPFLDCTPNSYRPENTNNDVTSIDEKDQDAPLQAAALTIYPNPSNGLFVIKSESDELKDIYVYNLLGDLIFEKTAASGSQFTIDITDQPKGVYFVKIVEKEIVKTGRMIYQ